MKDTTMNATCEINELNRTIPFDPLAEVSELVLSAQAGDRAAFGRLIERYEHTVYAVAMRRLRNPAEAEELVQEVFVQALQKLGQLREPAAVGGWLRSITVHMAINRLTRRSPVMGMEPEVIDGAGSDVRTPLAEVLDQERHAQVRAGLRRLRKLDRQTLEAFYFDGDSLVEMAVRFDAPVGTIKRRLHVARGRLAKELEELATV